jgi:hypothetical protein
LKNEKNNIYTLNTRTVSILMIGRIMAGIKYDSKKHSSYKYIGVQVKVKGKVISVLN